MLKVLISNLFVKSQAVASAEKIQKNGWTIDSNLISTFTV